MFVKRLKLSAGEWLVLGLFLGVLVGIGFSRITMEEKPKVNPADIARRLVTVATNPSFLFNCGNLQTNGVMRFESLLHPKAGFSVLTCGGLTSMWAVCTLMNMEHCRSRLTTLNRGVRYLIGILLRKLMILRALSVKFRMQRLL